jgi:hypothetical protein
MSKCKTKKCDCWMAGECLLEVRQGLEQLGVPMEGCPPMFYREAVHNLYVWSARAGRDCQRDHNWHDGNDEEVAKCIVANIKEQAKGQKAS